MSNASVANLLLISFDRYFSITRPLTYRAKRTAKKAAIMITFGWVISFFLWTPIIISWPYIHGERTIASDECKIQFIDTNKYVTVGTAIIAFYLPVSVMCILYFKIWRETIKRQKEVKHLQAQNVKKSNKKNYKYNKNKRTSESVTTTTKLIKSNSRLGKSEDMDENESRISKKSDSFVEDKITSKEKAKFNLSNFLVCSKLIDNDDDNYNGNNSASDSNESSYNKINSCNKYSFNNQNQKSNRICLNNFNQYLAKNEQVKLRSSSSDTSNNCNKNKASSENDDTIYTILIELPLKSKANVESSSSKNQSLFDKTKDSNEILAQKVKIKQIKCTTEKKYINSTNEDQNLYENNKQQQPQQQQAEIKCLKSVDRNAQQSKRHKIEKKQDQKAAKTLSAILLAFIITCKFIFYFKTQTKSIKFSNNKINVNSKIII